MRISAVSWICSSTRLRWQRPWSAPATPIGAWFWEPSDCSLLVETLGAHHYRKEFSSGVAALGRYFREQVTQDVRRLATACYVALDSTTGKVAGFYTLAAGGVPLDEMPESLAKRLPHYPSVPVARLDRLAVDLAYQGHKLGAMLLWDAATRAAKSEVAVFALVVDAKGERAAAFYHHHGFAALGSAPRQLILSLTNFRRGQ